MHDKDFLENARDCFRQAAEATNPDNMRLLVELGLEYLRIASREATVSAVAPGDDARLRFH
jgi:hypothetical protein